MLQIFDMRITFGNYRFVRLKQKISTRQEKNIKIKTKLESKGKKRIRIQTLAVIDGFVALYAKKFLFDFLNDHRNLVLQENEGNQKKNA